jgi:molybdate transport repressor ModE-like protein
VACVSRSLLHTSRAWLLLRRGSRTVAEPGGLRDVTGHGHHHHHREPFDDVVFWTGLQMRSLVAFVAVAEEGSFGAAARRLGYSRSTIGHQITQLESVVGTELVKRGPGFREVVVTPAGRVVLAHGRAVMRLLEHARRQLGQTLPDSS